MLIEFQAKKVDYGEAIDGQIVQVSFEEDQNEYEDDPLTVSYKYLLISTGNFEFEPPTADAEWFDGVENRGGIRVVAYSLEERKAVFRLENGYVFEIGHRADPVVLRNIRSYLARHCKDLDT